MVYSTQCMYYVYSTHSTLSSCSIKINNCIHGVFYTIKVSVGITYTTTEPSNLAKTSPRKKYELVRSVNPKESLSTGL